MKKFYLFAAALSVLVACEKNNGSDGGKTTDPITEVTYAGETYKVVTLSNGSIWMAENLRYVPKGKTVSDDPKSDAGIWYPYEVQDGAAVALTDEASIKEKGYLYDMETALGATLTADNFKTFEGVRGICPEGWHIPSRAEWMALVGGSTKAEGETEAPTDNTALYYDEGYEGAKIASLVSGMGLELTGYRQKNIFTAAGAYAAKPVLSESNCSVEEYYGAPALSYLMSSTAYKVFLNDDNSLKNIQFFGLMTTFTLAKYPEGRATLSYSGSKAGVPLRCVKDAE